MYNATPNKHSLYNVSFGKGSSFTNVATDAWYGICKRFIIISNSGVKMDLVSQNNTFSVDLAMAEA